MKSREWLRQKQLNMARRRCCLPPMSLPPPHSLRSHIQLSRWAFPLILPPQRWQRRDFATWQWFPGWLRAASNPPTIPYSRHSPFPELPLLLHFVSQHVPPALCPLAGFSCQFFSRLAFLFRFPLPQHLPLQSHPIDAGEERSKAALLHGA